MKSAWSVGFLKGAEELKASEGTPVSCYPAYTSVIVIAETASEACNAVADRDVQSVQKLSDELVIA